jgi:serine/threonine protein kinase
VQYQGAANYKFRKILGEGAVGEVWEVIHKETQELYAIKRVNKHQAKLVSLGHIFIS